MRFLPNQAAICVVLLALLCPCTAHSENPLCNNHTPLECISTKNCVLECLTSAAATPWKCDRYRCRPAVDACESTYIQADLTKEKCEALPGCSFQAAACFCPGPMLCTCGGGPPPRCRKS